MKLTSPLKTVLMFAVLTLVCSLAVQAQTVRANVPFAFVAGDRMMPAGVYKLVLNARNNLIELVPPDETGAYLAAHWSTFGTADERGSMVFHKYGDSYFLKRVKTAATTQGFEFYPTRKERDAAKRVGVFEVAMVTTYDK